MSGSDILSQDEIDALLSGVEGGDVETVTDKDIDGGAIRNYDFTGQDRIVRGRMPTLEMINERFARSFRISLFGMLRRSPDIAVEGVTMSKFSEYIHGLFMPSNMNMVKIKPLRGTALIVMNPKLVFSLVDNYFGGSNKFHTKIEGRDFTAIEMRVVKKVLERVFADMQDAWAPVLSIEFIYTGSEVNPQFANIVSPSEVVVVSSFHIDIEGEGGDLHVTIPYSTIEPIRETLDAGVQSDVTDVDERWILSLREEINRVRVTLKSTLTTIDMPVRKLLELKAGDVIPLEIPERVTATVDDVPVFRGRYGESRGRFALKVEEYIDADLGMDLQKAWEQLNEGKTRPDKRLRG